MEREKGIEKAVEIWNLRLDGSVICDKRVNVPGGGPSAAPVDGRSSEDAGKSLSNGFCGLRPYAFFSQPVGEKKNFGSIKPEWDEEGLRIAARHGAVKPSESRSDRARRIMAERLHDKVGQMLFSTKLKVEMLKSHPLDESSHQLVGEIGDLLSRTIHEVRSLLVEVKECRPRRQELSERLRDLDLKTSRRHSLNVVFKEGEGIGPLAEEVGAVLVRVAGELLHNAVKHSRADRVQMTLKSDPRRIYLTVEDNGVGLERYRRRPERLFSKGYGLFSINENLGSVGGALIFYDEPGRGFKVVAYAPLELS